MRFDTFCSVLSANKYFVFTPDDAGLFFPDEKRTSVNQYLSRWKKYGYIAPLRRGLYELVYPEKRELSDFYLANRIYSPSYVSLETALSHYGLIPEVSMGVTSVTAKTTRRFKNKYGLFAYCSVQPEMFCGYLTEVHQEVEVMIAEPEKALADWFYLRSKRTIKMDPKALRLDRKRILTQLNQNKMVAYGRLCGIDLKEEISACL